MRYLYSLVRYVPEPIRGEFVNIGVLAGSYENDDWTLRLATNTQRLAALGSKLAWRTARDGLDALSHAVGNRQTYSLDDSWMTTLSESYRSVLQLSPPIPVSAVSAADAAGKVFSLLVNDPEVTYRRPGGVQVKNQLRSAYHRLPLGRETFLEHVSLEVEGRKELDFDFAVANGRLVQLAAAWSFNIKTVDRVATDVRAWGFSVGLIRDPKKNSRIVIDDSRTYDVPDTIDIEAVFEPPTTPAGDRALERSLRVFDEIEVRAVPVLEVSGVAARASEALMTH